MGGWLYVWRQSWALLTIRDMVKARRRTSSSSEGAFPWTSIKIARQVEHHHTFFRPRAVLPGRIAHGTLDIGAAGLPTLWRAQDRPHLHRMKPLKRL